MKVSAEELALLIPLSPKNSSGDSHASFEGLAALAADICGTAHACVAVLDEHGKWSIYPNDIPKYALNGFLEFCGDTLLAGDVLVTSSAEREARFRSDLEDSEGRVCFYAGAPFFLPASSIAGTVSLIDCVPRELGSAEQNALRGLARQAGSSLELQRQLEEAKAACVQRDRLAERNAALVQTVGELFYEWNVATGDLIWTGDFTRILGYLESEMGNKTESWTGRVHPQDLQNVLEEVKNAERERRLYDLQYRFRHRNGHYIWMHDRGVLYFDSEGKLNRIVGVLRDINRQKQIQEVLQEKEMLVQMAAEAARLGVWQVDLKSNRMAPLRATGPISGLPRELRPSTREEFFALIHPEDRAMVSERIERTVQRGDDYHVEFRIVLPDAKCLWVAAQGTCLRDSAGTPALMTGVDVDITERKRFEEQLRQSQTMDAVGQLAGGIGHDFNNLLTIIEGHASLLLSSASLTGAAADSAREILEAAERAGNLTRQLLTFSRKQVMQPAHINLNDLIPRSAKSLRRTLGHGIQLDVQLAPRLPSIYADKAMLEQLLLNLVLNSRDAMPNGGRLVIATQAERIGADQIVPGDGAREGDAVRLSLSDNGAGIPHEHLPRIFEPFFTTKEVGKGSGLGLATAYGIVRQHQGWIRVQSDLGKGATFHIFFPASNTDLLAAPATRLEPPARGDAETILIVEDEAHLRSLVRAILEDSGYSVLEASDGPAALKLWEKQKSKIRLVLTDMIMPEGMTGHDLAQRLRAERPDLEIIYSSGYSADLFTKGMTLKDGMNFLQKPYLPRKLLEMVRSCLDRT